MSTIHNNEMTSVNSKHSQWNPVLKPKAVVDYNMGVGGADKEINVWPTIRVLGTRKENVIKKNISTHTGSSCVE